MDIARVLSYILALSCNTPRFSNPDCAASQIYAVPLFNWALSRIQARKLYLSVPVLGFLDRLGQPPILRGSVGLVEDPLHM